LDPRTVDAVTHAEVEAPIAANLLQRDEEKGEQ
jgi:hypothetical protein